MMVFPVAQCSGKTSKILKLRTSVSYLDLTTKLDARKYAAGISQSPAIMRMLIDF